MYGFVININENRDGAKPVTELTWTWSSNAKRRDRITCYMYVELCILVLDEDVIAKVCLFLT